MSVILETSVLNEAQETEGVYTAGRAGHIRSFVLRQGRVSNAQQRYYDEMMAKIGIPYADSLLDLDAVFGRRAPHILEIGFGMGETSAMIAAANPQNDYVGVEVHTPGVGSLCKLVAEKGLANQRIIQHDAVEVLRDMIPESSLDGVATFTARPTGKTTPSRCSMSCRPNPRWRTPLTRQPGALRRVPTTGR